MTADAGRPYMFEDVDSLVAVFDVGYERGAIIVGEDWKHSFWSAVAELSFRAGDRDRDGEAAVRAALADSVELLGDVRGVLGEMDAAPALRERIDRLLATADEVVRLRIVGFGPANPSPDAGFGPPQGA